MRNSQENKRWRRILESPLSLGFFFMLLLFFAWGVIRFMGRLAETSRNKENALVKVAELQKSKEHFSYEIENLKTEKGLEENIREKFPVVKEGEGLIMVVDDKNTSETDSVEEKNWFKFFLKNWFK